MARRNRNFSTFSLSFIDAMSCGLGAVILLFMIINHAAHVRAQGGERNVAANLSQLEAEVLERRQAVEKLAAALEQARQRTEAARARARQLQASLETDKQRDKSAAQTRKHIAALKKELKNIQTRVEQLRQQAEKGNATRKRRGEGHRIYLTGLRITGSHILILVDASTSMLAKNIVNIIIRRNLGAAAKLESDKWQRTVETVDWVTTQVPASSKFQIYTFNDDTQSVLEATTGQWLSTNSGARLTKAVQALTEVVPSGGTNLREAFLAASRLSPLPDNIYLITDGLPTQGAEPTSGAVSAEQRMEYFRAAVQAVPPGVSVHVMLMPMEGDPMAASAFWALALGTNGSFLSPSVDWP